MPRLPLFCCAVHIHPYLLLKLDAEGDHLSPAELLHLGLDLGEPLVGLAQVVTLRQVHQVDYLLGRQHLELVQHLSIV